jgi:hypothetical protein
MFIVSSMSVVISPLAVKIGITRKLDNLAMPSRIQLPCKLTAAKINPHYMSYEVCLPPLVDDGLIHTVPPHMHMLVK